MRKILSFVLVLSLVLGSFSFAFAAPAFSDVDDENVLKAVKRLNAFGIVDGYEDGTYRPERTIKRSEFAKLLVTALGLDNAAQAAMGSSQFTDVAGNEWFAGYVEVAAGQGLVKGYPDGTFRPENTVTYGEAITMLVRALGYKDEWLPGSWPGNYIAKAAELDITDDVTFTPSGLADRGSVAVLLNNTLDAETIVQERMGDNNDFIKSGKTLLFDKLSISKIKEARVISVPRVDGTLDSDELRLSWVTTSGSATGGKFEVVADVDYDYLLGLTVNAYTNKDGDLIYVETVDKDYEVYYDVVKEDDGNLKLVNKNSKFKLASENALTAYVNNKPADFYDDGDVDFDPISDGTFFAKVVLDKNNKVGFIDAFKLAGDSGVVTSVNVKDEVIEYFDADGNDEEVTLSELADEYVLLGTQWNALTLEDVEENDVIYMTGKVENQATGDDTVYVFVVRETVEGELDRYKLGSKPYVRIGGKDYDLNEFSTISLNKDKDIVNIIVDSTDELEDASGEEVLALIGIDGTIRHITTDVEASTTSQYGIIVKADTGLVDRVRIYTENDEIVTYDVDDKVKVKDPNNPDDPDFNNFTDIENIVTENNGKLFVKYELDSDGVVETITVIANLADDLDNLDDNDTLSIGSFSTNNPAGRNSINRKLIKSDSITVFNASDFKVNDWDTKKLEVMTYAELYEKDPDSGKYILALDNGKVAAILVYANLETKAEDVYVGYLIDSYKRSNKDYAEIDVVGLGLGEYKLDSKLTTQYSEIGDERVVLFKMQENGIAENVAAYVYADTSVTKEIDVENETDDSDFEDYVVYLNAVVTGRSGRDLTFKDDNGNKVTYRVASDAVIYEEDDTISLFNVVASDDYVYDLVVNTKDGEVLVIKRIEK